MRFPLLPSALIAGLLLASLSAAENESGLPGKTSDFGGYSCHDFELEGHKCRVVAPKQVAEGKPWIWRARFWGHRKEVDLALLSEGFHVAFIDVSNLYGSAAALKRWDLLYDYLTGTQGFHRKPALEGMSRGGLIIFNWASENPDKASCIYADAPVCDIRSWPGGLGQGRGSKGDWQRCLGVYQLSEEQAKLFALNPIDRLAPLAKAGIPLIHVVGDADRIVPVAENTAVLEQRYKNLGGSITVIHKPGVGHKHGLDDPQPVVNFILKHTRGQAIPISANP